jgi:fumarylpyruvate hydrolase
VELVFERPAGPTIAVAGSDRRFPVGSIYCVGRNYADHAVEMGGDPDREPPFFFVKPPFAILADNAPMTYPKFTSDLHHEVELVVAMGEEGIFGYAVGIDMTRRDLQGEAKEKSRPWEAGKTFAHAAPCGAIQPESSVLNEAGIQLSINGEVRQSGNVNQMIWKIPEIIERLSELFVLAPGDLIYTGTPAGVGPVEVGDAIEASVGGLPALSFKVRS